MDFEINLILPIELFFLHDQKVMSKIPWEWKELLRWNKKDLSSFLKGFQLLKIVSDLRVQFLVGSVKIFSEYCMMIFLLKIFKIVDLNSHAYFKLLWSTLYSKDLFVNLSRSSLCLHVFFILDVAKNFAKFTGKHLSKSLLLIKLLCHKFFSVNFASF